MRCFLMVTVLLSLLIQPAFSADVAGVKLAETVESGGQQLQLNGYGIRKKFFFKIYVGSLYTAQQASSSDQVINGAGGKLIRMNFLYSKVEKEKIIDGFAEGIKKNSPELVKDPAVISFLGWFDADFVAGDQVDLTISADGRVSASHNNRPLGTLNSPALARGVLLIYLGNQPADSDMKKGMLGKY